jgi:hypothetical protein
MSLFKRPRGRGVIAASRPAKVTIGPSDDEVKSRFELFEPIIINGPVPVRGMRIGGKFRRRRRRTSLHDHEARPHPYQVGEFIAAYMTRLLAFTAATGLLASIGEPHVLAAIGVAYVGCGISLRRFLHRRLRWFRQTANIAVIVEVKLHIIISWPVSVLVFIVQMAIGKSL